MNRNKAIKKIDPCEQGFEAFLNEQGADTNPYVENTSAFDDWVEGYLAGMESWDAICAKEVAAGFPHPDK